jgi:hypothetical protein
LALSQLQDVTDLFMNETDELPLFVGHMTGGLLAKALAVQNGAFSVAFESPVLNSSLLSHRIDSSEEENDQVFNLYSPRSFFAHWEPGPSHNVKLPVYQRFWKPANPYETFCVLAAACVTTNEFDDICNKAVTEPKYRTYFQVWHRDRFDVTGKD